MRIIAVFVLAGIAVLLFVLSKTRIITDGTIERLARIGSILSAIAAVTALFLPISNPRTSNTRFPSIPNETSINREDFNSPRVGSPVEGNIDCHYLSEEQIRKKIEDYLNKSGDVESSILLLPCLSSDSARDEECQHIFDYCLKNNKLKEAEEVAERFYDPLRKEDAKKLLELEKLKQR